MLLNYFIMETIIFIDEHGNKFTESNCDTMFTRALSKGKRLFRDVKYRENHYRLYPEHGIAVDVKRNVFFEYDSKEILDTSRFNLLQGRFAYA